MFLFMHSFSLSFLHFSSFSRLPTSACVWFSFREIVHVHRFSYCDWLILATWITWNAIHFIVLNEKTVETHSSGVVFNIDLYNSIGTKSSQNKFNWTCACVWPTTTIDSHFNSSNHLSSDSLVCVRVRYFFPLFYSYFVFWLQQFSVSASLVCSWNLLKRQIGSKDLLSVGNKIHT